MVTKARDVMSSHVKSIEEDASLQEAAAKMLSERISSLIVDPKGQDQPFGIITSKDIISAFANDRDLRETKVGEFANTPLTVITPGVPVAYAARLMKRSNVRHLVVFNGIEIVGVLSNIDVLRALIDSTQEQIRTNVSATSQAAPQVKYTREICSLCGSKIDEYGLCGCGPGGE